MRMDLAIVVGGNEKFENFFKNRFTVYHAKKVDDVYEGLKNGSIPVDCGVVIINPSGEVDDGRGELEGMIAQFASEACVCVYAANDEAKSGIRNRVVKTALADSYPSAPFYFFGKKRPLVSILGSIEEWTEWRDHADEATVQEAMASAPASLTKRKGSTVITVTSAKGGSGKSSTAILLSSQIALSTKAAGDPKSVCVVDMDVFDGQLGFMIGENEPNIINLVTSTTGDDRVDFAPEHVREIAVKKILHKKNGSPTGVTVDYYLSPKMGLAAHAAPDPFYYKLILSLTQMYDFIIIDTSINYLTDARVRKVCLPLADVIVYMTQTIVQARLDMSRWFKYVARPKTLSGIGINPKKIGIVINRAPSNVKDFLNDVYIAANPEWTGEGDPGVRVIGAIPDAPSRVFNEAGNSYELERLLYDSQYGIGTSFFRLAKSVIPKSVELLPVADSSPSRPRQQEDTRRPIETPEPEETEKKGFLSRLFKH